MTRAVAFDLDDTLLLERDFVHSGFAAVDRALHEWFDVGYDWLGNLWRGFERGVRGDAFNRVLAEAGVEITDDLVGRLVQVYREHKPSIERLDDVLPALEQLGLPPQQVGIITDGPVVMQKRKFESLELADRFGHVIYTDRWGVEFRKPHPRAFEEFERLTGCPRHECAYVADNPTKDFRAPHERGWRTIRLARPGGLHGKMPSAPGEVDVTITDLFALAEALDADRP